MGNSTAPEAKSAITITTDRGADGRRAFRTAVAGVVLIVSLSVGGCSVMMPEGWGGDHVANPLTDEQSRIQVVEPARQIAQVASPPGIFGAFWFGRCTPGGPPYPPPYRGVVEMSLEIPFGMQADAYFAKIAATMVAHGWADGASPGLNPVGRVINKGGVTAVMTAGERTGWGKVQLLGECRNETAAGDYGRRRGSDITDQLRQR
jgi:hypothetical protein